MCILIWMKSGCGISPSFSFLTNERVHSTNLFIHDLWSLKPPYAVGIRKNTAQSITRRQRKQSKKAGHIRRSFERPVPEIFSTCTSV